MRSSRSKKCALKPKPTRSEQGNSSMLIVAGLSLKNLQPHVWRPESPYYVPALQAVMVSYGEFHQMPKQMQKAKAVGLREYLGVPAETKVFLDNGAFYFLRSGDLAEQKDYEKFVDETKPDWYPMA